jgi:hypothetical protein
VNYKSIAALLLNLVVTSNIAARANSFSQPSEFNVIELKLSDLRSAYLIRAGIVRYDANANSPDQIRAQLQRHFDVVIGLLLVSTPRSVETAMARLEAKDDHTWSTAERSNWRQKLLSMRSQQLRRLAAYRDRGLFPLNEGQSPRPVPIFVDEHNTACAVGHLMRISGWQSAVVDIQRRNNLVYIPDALNSAVAAWTLTSGLTHEEAALIQPAYRGFPAPYYVSNYEPGELSLIQNVLKYENFQFDALNFTNQTGLGFHQIVDLCDGCFFTPAAGSLPNFNSVGFNAGIGTLQGVTFFDNYDPIGTHWISLGGELGAPIFSSRLIGGSTQMGTIQRIRLSFDVSTTDPNSYVSQIAEHTYPSYGGFGGFPGTSQYEFTTKALQSVTPLGTVNFGEDNGVQSASAGLSSQTDHLTVTTTIWLYNGATIGSYVLGFQVVPEPASLLLMLVSVAAATASLRPRRRQYLLSLP